MMDQAVLDGQRLAGVELDTDRTIAKTFDGQAAQADGVVRPGIDHDAGGARRDLDFGIETTRVQDVDRLVDDDRGAANVAGRTENDDLAAGIGLRKRGLEVPARRGYLLSLPAGETNVPLTNAFAGVASAPAKVIAIAIATLFRFMERPQ
jgi:hypothetical protein